MNWLTMLPAIFGLDDKSLAFLFGAKARREAVQREKEAKSTGEDEGGKVVVATRTRSEGCPGSASVLRIPSDYISVCVDSALL